MKVNNVIIANFYVANMSFGAIRENKILAKISEFTVIGHQTPIDRCALRPLVKSEYLKIEFIISQPNICCGYSKEPAQYDGSLEHPKHMLKLMDNKNIQFYTTTFCLSKPN